MLLPKQALYQTELRPGVRDFAENRGFGRAAQAGAGDLFSIHPG